MQAIEKKNNSIQATPISEDFGERDYFLLGYEHYLFSNIYENAKYIRATTFLQKYSKMYPQVYFWLDESFETLLGVQISDSMITQISRE
jgi:hypothetical protein